MAINTKLINFDMNYNQFQSNANGLQNKNTKDSNGNIGNIPYTSIVFLKDGIWTHNKFIRGFQSSFLNNYVTLSGEDQTISGNKHFSSNVVIDSLQAGNLIVKGSARFIQTILGNIQTADKVNYDLTIQLNGGTSEGTNKFTFNGSTSKSINITPSSIGAQPSGSYMTTSHPANVITSANITNWNSIYNWYSTDIGDANTKIDKWKEVEAFLDGISDTSNLNSILNQYVTLETSQIITGTKTFEQAINADILGNATTADRLKNNCTIELSGFVSGSASFNGSNITIVTTSDSSVSGDGNSTGDWNKYITVKINGTSKTLKIPDKPIYKFSDLTEHPTTLEGYGITNAVTKEADIILQPVHTNIQSVWSGQFTSTEIPDAKWILSGESGLLKNLGTGSYLIQIIHSTDSDGGIYTGYFSYTTGSGTDEEIILHRSGNNTTQRLYAKIKYINNTTCLLLAAKEVESDCTELTIKMKKLL